MLSLRKTKDSEPIAINDKTAKMIYLNPDLELEKNSVEEDNLAILPRCDEKREVVYIAAPSGTGKTHLAKKYIEFYSKINKGNDIFIFSKIEDDQTLKGLKVKNLFKIPIDRDLVENPIDVQNEMKDCLVLLDDVDQIADKEVDKAMTVLMNSILETGRHKNITCIITSHQILNPNKQRLRTILNEVHRIVIFPKSTTFHNVSYFLSQYIGITDKKEIEKITKLPGRWVCVQKVFPMYIMYQKGVYMV